ncbi:probable inactive receptor kinase At2g26730 [Carica papaya]|uniref:probable inactive receptor kinase At2g26730 n=1 Tax=Carica papaya TaxID=3649 RepID=UPI000B8CC2C4|nr:probable inactive receptor kinase At2g26730 [Carica papaya]
MHQIPIWVFFISFFLIIQTTDSLDGNTTRSLYNFLAKLSNFNGCPDHRLNWNLSTDPCKDEWEGVSCDLHANNSVQSISLDDSNLSGVFDATLVCNVDSLASSLNIISLEKNSLAGEISEDIANCKQLTRLLLGGNKLSGNLPRSIPLLNNLKRLDVSHNNLSGELPKDLSKISGLTMLLAENNKLTGKIPDLDFSNLKQFNLSNNNFKGRIPDVHGLFSATCFLGNPELCGEPLPNRCPNPPVSKTQMIMYSGYVASALVLLSMVIFLLARRKKKQEKIEEISNKLEPTFDDKTDKPGPSPTDYKADHISMSRSQVSGESALVSSSLVVLTSPVVNGLKLEDLLKAPAELLGRGKRGTLYKVILDNGAILAVKRIKDWSTSSNDFKNKMQRLYQVKHPNVSPALAFYCSDLEKLVVYEYQQNGSLFRLLHGSQTGEVLDWSCRLGIAATIAEALNFMQQELSSDGISHGNLKSCNILFNRNMEPCISEYGIMAVEDNQGNSSSSFSITIGGSDEQEAIGGAGAFSADIYNFGVIVLELLTGKVADTDGRELTRWVQSVVKEEGRVDVFDKRLISEGASEERMVSLLEVAMKCVNSSAEARPSIDQVSVMINAIREEEERSIGNP